jgi:hypothetical protein
VARLKSDRANGGGLNDRHLDRAEPWNHFSIPHGGAGPCLPRKEGKTNAEERPSGSKASERTSSARSSPPM